MGEEDHEKAPKSTIDIRNMKDFEKNVKDFEKEVFGGENFNDESEQLKNHQTIKNRKNQSEVAMQMMRLCAFCFAIVSWVATAKGMQTFAYENGWQAYLASFAVQGSLIVYNFFLPIFLGKRRKRENEENKITEDKKEGYILTRKESFNALWIGGALGGVIATTTLLYEYKKVHLGTAVNTPFSKIAFAIMLGGMIGWIVRTMWRIFKSTTLSGLLFRVLMIVIYIITILVSSWFSYVYIADNVYSGIWPGYCQMNVQSGYRNSLFSLSDYVDSSLTYIEENLSNRLFELYTSTVQMASATKEDGKGTELQYDYEKEREKFPDENAASTYMRIAIGAMESLQKDKSANNRETVRNALNTQREALENAHEEIEGEIEIVEDKRGQENTRLEEIRIALRRNGENAALNREYQRTSEEIQTTGERISDLERQREDYADAIKRINEYIVSMDFALNSNTMIGLEDTLNALQNALLKKELDMNTVTNAIEKFYQFLQQVSVIDLVEANDQNLQLLQQFNSLERELDVYTLLVDLKTRLKDETDSLKFSTAGIISDKPENTDDVQRQESGAQDQEDAEQKDVREIDETDQWRVDWSQRIELLKALIAETPDVGQLDIGANKYVVHIGIKNYDRSLALSELDDLTRRYLLDNSELQKAVLYLAETGSGRVYALFALYLSLFVDFSAAAIGIVMYMQGDAPSDRGMDMEEKSKYE